jgi:Holliday junction resolvasome RuvABC DNA-binding subunit
LLELKGKLADALPTAAHAVEDSQHDILNALLALGYNDREASAVMKQLPPGTVHLGRHPPGPQTTLQSLMHQITPPRNRSSRSPSSRCC